MNRTIIRKGSLRSSLGPYIAILIVRFQMLLQYRAAAIAGFGTQIWWGGIMVMAMAAFYLTPGAETRDLPLSLAEIITYIWLGQALLALLPWNTDAEIQEMVRTGNVAYEQIRPVDTYWLWYMRSMATRTAPPILRGIPLVAFAAFILPLAGLDDWALKPPPDFTAAALFTVSLLAVIFLTSAITALISISVIWSISGQGINTLAMPVVTFFSGMIVPLPFFPGWMQPFLNAQPFRGLVDVPFRIYLGDLAGIDAFLGIVHQVIWTAILIAFGRWLMARAMKQLVVQGG